ncbi:MAG: methyltransferase domain-containing protein, partial [Magnetococcales bacterium]|nr:methyltransferase domain-containing protein [Magnetococcales bacterium]
RIERCNISGKYLGIDIKQRDSWEHIKERVNCKIKADFLVLPAQHMDLREQFNFVVCSHSLEHQEFPQDTLMKTYSAMKPGAFGLFFVPAPWAYFLYGHHGWRNFQPKLIDELFSNACLQIVKIYGLGGLPSFILHVLAISWLETASIYESLSFGRIHWRLNYLLKLLKFNSMRKNKFSLILYQYFSNLTLYLDKFLPRPHHLYCIVIRRPASNHGDGHCPPP